MRGQYTSLSSIGGSEIEIEDTWFSESFLLNQTLVDDASRRRVGQLPTLIGHEETLSDTLVHNNNSDLRLFVLLIVDFGYCSVELADFSLEDLITLLLANSISVYNEVGRLASLLVFENLNRLLNQEFHLVLHKLLTLRLNNVVREVLTQSFISASCKSNYTRLTCVADIDSNEHGLKFSDYLRELHREEVTSNFAVHLPDDVRRLRRVETLSISGSDDLRRHLILIKSKFVHGVIVFTTQYSENDEGMAELIVVLLVNHVSSQPSF